MKNKLLYISLFTLLSLSFTNAQELKKISWESHRLSFSTPVDMTITSSNTASFAAEGEFSGFEADLVNDLNFSEKRYEEYLKKYIGDLFDLSDIRISQTSNAGFISYYSEIPISEEILFYTLLLVDEQSQKAYIFRIALMENAKQSAKTILSSFELI